jgi:hypothetical protein
MKAPARSDSSASFAVIVFGIATRIFGWFSVGVVVPFAQSRHQKDRYDRQRSVTGPDIGCRIAVPLRCDA